MEELQHAAVKVISDSGTVFLEPFPLHVLSMMDHDMTRWAAVFTVPSLLVCPSQYRWEIKQGTGSWTEISAQVE